MRNFDAMRIFENRLQQIEKIGGKRAPDARFIRDAQHGERQVAFD